MAGPILRLKDMIAHTGLSRTVIYDRMNEKSARYAANFPKSFSLGGGAIGWFQSDVDAWLESCAANVKSETKKKKVLATPTRKKQTIDGPSAPMALTVLPEQADKLPQQQLSPPKPADPLASAKRSNRKGNLAEAIVSGGRLNDRLLYFLQMSTWTAPMAALLIAGIDPPFDCHEIPDGGIGLDEKPLHGSNMRFHEARHILEEWQEWQDEQEVKQPDIEPIRFFNWCMEEEIKTEWLHLFLELIGFTDENAVDLTAARFALLTGCQTTYSGKGAGSAKSSDSITGEKSKEKDATVQIQDPEKGLEPTAIAVSIQPSASSVSGTQKRWTIDELEKLYFFHKANKTKKTAEQFHISGARVRKLLAQRRKDTEKDAQPSVWDGLGAKKK
ncbi:AlpA family transcriptional regulator [Devosia sp.]|uniref:helix-turn-helix transcriptional regulator n=1 Tax=Devosia sp. TaxID=1871048 RepID=UPI002735238F|nr:AlpA family transcriptional regulator [Devosia sp.]MDP2780066.1 AlpA family transcriptional regulator [Devosia sp.]